HSKGPQREQTRTIAHEESDSNQRECCSRWSFRQRFRSSEHDCRRLLVAFLEFHKAARFAFWLARDLRATAGRHRWSQREVARGHRDRKEPHQVPHPATRSQTSSPGWRGPGEAMILPKLQKRSVPRLRGQLGAMGTHPWFELPTWPVEREVSRSRKRYGSSGFWTNASQ